MSVVCSQVGMFKKKTQKKIKGRKARTLCFRQNKFSSFVSYLFESYYALFLGCLDLKFLPNIPYCVYWVVAQILTSNSFHKICHEFFIQHCNESKKFCFCVKLFDHFLTEYSSFLAEICRALSQNKLGFFHKISTRNSFWKCSINLLHSKPFLFPDLWNFALVSTILFWVHIAL